MKAADRQNAFKLFGKFTGVDVWQLQGSNADTPFFYEGGMAIDLDGAGNAYAPQGSGLPAVDNLGNAVPIPDKQGRSPWLVPPAKKTDLPTNPNWTPTFASTVRDPATGASVLQTTGPYAGYYISESSLKNVFSWASHKNNADDMYMTDASTFPYIALPPHHFKATHLKVGDYGLVIHGRSGQHTFVQFGDGKKKRVVIECSSATAKALSVPSDKNGGCSSGIVYLMFPDSGLGPGMRCDLADLPTFGIHCLRTYDNLYDIVAEVIRCFDPEYPGVRKAFRTLGMTA